MDIDRERRAHAVLLAALERSPENLPAFLADACGDDEEVRQEVERLLAGAGDELVERLDRPAHRLLAAEMTRGERLGAYVLERELGRGGMGTVFLAARSDAEFQRRVAIKVLRPELATSDLVRRFRAERQFLAQLAHPAIAELYDGGTTSDGRPYLVMEYVEGEPIDRYCERHGLDVRQRLELFAEVCGAVQVAHQNLIVHRDLKSSNILVTAAGQPKLLDFGIAKMLGPSASSSPLHTATGRHLMTPAYASPEQLSGAPITTASDVYSLGMLLFELLTGEPPYHLEGCSPTDVVRIVCEQRPRRPSAAIGDERGKLRRRLRGDLDNIVMMALRKEPRRRYASVEQLTRDLERHLAGLPVSARRDTLAYRTGKLLRRRAREVAAVATLILLLAGYAVDRTHQQRRTARERDKAERIASFLVDLFEVPDPEKGSGIQVTARQILDRGAAQARRELPEDPEIEAALLHTIGEVYRKLGFFAEARPLVEEAHALRRAAHGEEHVEVAESLVALAALAHEEGDAETSETIYRRALAVQQRLLGDEHADVAVTWNGLAQVLRARGEYDASEGYHRQALDLQRRLLPADHPDLTSTLNDLAVLLLVKDEELDVAEELFREALASERQRFGERHPRLEEVLSNLASALMRGGDFAAAEPLFRDALDIATEAFGDTHPSVARIANNLAWATYNRGDLASAEDLYRRALTVAEESLGPEHPNTARTINGLAVVHEARGDLATAESLLRRALGIQRQQGSDRPEVAATAALLARVLLARADATGAEALAREAVAIFKARLPPSHWRTAYGESLLAGALIARGRLAEAEDLLLAGYPLIRDAKGADSREARDTAARLAELCEARDETEKASQYRTLSSSS